LGAPPPGRPIEKCLGPGGEAKPRGYNFYKCHCFRPSAGPESRQFFTNPRLVNILAGPGSYLQTGSQFWKSGPPKIPVFKQGPPGNITKITFKPGSGGGKTGKTPAYRPDIKFLLKDPGTITTPESLMGRFFPTLGPPTGPKTFSIPKLYHYGGIFGCKPISIKEPFFPPNDNGYRAKNPCLIYQLSRELLGRLERKYF